MNNLGWMKVLVQIRGERDGRGGEKSLQMALILSARINNPWPVLMTNPYKITGEMKGESLR